MIVALKLATEKLKYRDSILNAKREFHRYTQPRRRYTNCNVSKGEYIANNMNCLEVASTSHRRYEKYTVEGIRRHKGYNTQILNVLLLQVAVHL